MLDGFPADVVEGVTNPQRHGGLQYVVIDELHWFVGTERGAQLQSLLHRLELAVRHRAPSIALSAMLGDSATAAEFLRPGAGPGVVVMSSLRRAVYVDANGDLRLKDTKTHQQQRIVLDAEPSRCFRSIVNGAGHVLRRSVWNFRLTAMSSGSHRTEASRWCGTL